MGTVDACGEEERLVGRIGEEILGPLYHLPIAHFVVRFVQRSPVKFLGVPGWSGKRFYFGDPVQWKPVRIGPLFCVYCYSRLFLVQQSRLAIDLFWSVLFLTFCVVQGALKLR